MDLIEYSLQCISNNILAEPGLSKVNGRIPAKYWSILILSYCSVILHVDVSERESEAIRLFTQANSSL